jgi:predicted amidohydrolase
MFWRSDERLPRVVVAAPGNIPLVRESGRAAAERRRFRVALCPLHGGFHTRFAIDPWGEFFTARDIAERAEFERHLEAVLEAAAAERVDLLVLPELCVDDEARGILTRAPRSHSTIAGSFHFVRPRRDLPADERPVNEAVLYTHSGEAVLTHHKRGLFRIPGSHVTSPTMERFFVDRPRVLAAQVVEGIRWGSEIQVLDTSLGRLAVLICADAIDENAEPYRTTIAQLRPDLLFVVAMSPETERFEAFSNDMAMRRIGTVFVNAACVCGIGRGATLAASDVALFEPPGSAPTRLRWREDRLERIGFHPKSWREHTPDAAAGWLGGERRLGLVVDLGVHWAE